LVDTHCDVAQLAAMGSEGRELTQSEMALEMQGLAVVLVDRELRSLEGAQMELLVGVGSIQLVVPGKSEVRYGVGQSILYSSVSCLVEVMWVDTAEVVIDEAQQP
jgi:hypothetical protein